MTYPKSPTLFSPLISRWLMVCPCPSKVPWKGLSLLMPMGVIVIPLMSMSDTSLAEALGVWATTALAHQSRSCPSFSA